MVATGGSPNQPLHVSGYVALDRIAPPVAGHQAVLHLLRSLMNRHNVMTPSVMLQCLHCQQQTLCQQHGDGVQYDA